ncbi:MAG TPA: arsenic transporter [Clostridiales bacterium UBA8153]|nr:arsenic transporter [Clostridiales bacterium UBA8153]
MREAALGLFIATYLLLLILPRIRSTVALVSASAYVGLGIVPLGAVTTTIDWNVILMIFGTMGVVSLFIRSKMPSLMADLIIDRMPDVRWANIALAIFAGFVSAFIDNVATVLMVAPVALNIARKLNISPVPAVIAIAISSNLQGAATLVGDTTSVLLGGYAGLDFTDFIVFQGRPGIFWAVQAGMVASLFVLLYLFRKDTTPIHLQEMETVDDYFPSGLLVGMFLLLILASFVPGKPDITNGLICTGLFAIGIIHRLVAHQDPATTRATFMDIDYSTILLLAGLFVVIGGLARAGIVAEIGDVFARMVGGDRLLAYKLIVAGSVLLSAVIDNIPYTATMLPVVASVAHSMGTDPYLFYFGLLIGATLGGNITPVGASANIAGLGILRRHGHHVGTLQFMAYGLPFTLAAVTAGALFLWLVWS